MNIMPVMGYSSLNGRLQDHNNTQTNPQTFVNKEEKDLTKDVSFGKFPSVKAILLALGISASSLTGCTERAISDAPRIEHFVNNLFETRVNEEDRILFKTKPTFIKINDEYYVPQGITHYKFLNSKGDRLRIDVFCTKGSSTSSQPDLKITIQLDERTMPEEIERNAINALRFVNSSRFVDDDIGTGIRILNLKTGKTMHPTRFVFSDGFNSNNDTIILLGI